MRQLLYVLMGLIPVSLLVGCSDKLPQPQTATIIYFTEQETGTEPYRTRMLVTPNYLRIDDGVDDDGFVLFDRRQQTIYSANPDNRRTLVIKMQPVNYRPSFALRHRISRDKETYPKVSDRPVSHYRLFTNDKKCQEVFAAQGLLPDAVAAMREYYQVLATEHAQLARNTPPDLQNACDLASNVVLPTRYLQFGFPVMLIDSNGRVRQLQDYKTKQPVAPALFTLPAGYLLFTTQSLRNGKKI